MSQENQVLRSLSCSCFAHCALMLLFMILGKGHVLRISYQQYLVRAFKGSRLAGVKAGAFFVFEFSDQWFLDGFIYFDTRGLGVLTFQYFGNIFDCSHHSTWAVENGKILHQICVTNNNIPTIYKIDIYYFLYPCCAKKEKKNIYGTATDCIIAMLSVYPFLKTAIKFNEFCICVLPLTFLHSAEMLRNEFVP